MKTMESYNDMKRLEQIEDDIFKIRNLSDYLKKYKNIYKEMLLMYREDKEFYQNTYTNSNYNDSDLEYAIKLCNLYLSNLLNLIAFCRIH